VFTYKRISFLEDTFARDIGDPRFIPYLQLHEYEAYLFSDPTAFRLFYEDQEAQISILTSIADSCDTPELINDDPNSAPSKRIIKQFPRYQGAKPVQGTQIAELIGLEGIRSKCPHFSTWVSKLEQLGE